MDQSNRYAALQLNEDDLIEGGKHILVAYTMKPKARTAYLEASSAFYYRILDRYECRSIDY